MQPRSRAFAALLALIVPVLVLVAPQAAEAGQQQLFTAPVASSACHYTSGTLRKISAAGPLVHMEKRFKAYSAQYVDHSYSLQGLSGSTWHNVKGHQTDGKQALVTKSHVRRWQTLKRTTVRVPKALSYSGYRVQVIVRWHSPATYRVDKTQRLVLAAYSTGSWCATKQPAAGTTTGAPAKPAAPARGGQAVSVAADHSSSTTGAAFGGAYSTSGVKGSETATMTLYGPQTSPAGCTGAVAQQSSTTISSDSTYPLPAAAPGVSGYYYWGVSLAGDGQVTAASACAPAPVTVVKPISISVADGARYTTAPITAVVTISGFDRQQSASWSGVLWGPYSTLAAAQAANCTGSLHHTITANAAISPAAGSTYQHAVSTTVGQSAFWTWGAIYNGTALEGSAHVCSAVFHTLT